MFYYKNSNYKLLLKTKSQNLKINYKYKIIKIQILKTKLITYKIKFKNQ